MQLQKQKVSFLQDVISLTATGSKDSSAPFSSLTSSPSAPPDKMPVKKVSLFM